MGFVQKIFGSQNERELKKLRPLVDRIASFEGSMEDKSDAELKAMTPALRERLANGEPLDKLLPEAFAVVREVGKRTVKMRHYDVQMVGGIILHQGRIAEMRTGEGKTLVATLPAYLNALEGKGVHVVTVNDYLASRDAEWMGEIYRYLGLDVGVIVHGKQDYERQREYMCDIAYGQNSEFGFDYLRDNMKQSPDRMVQRPLHYAIVDEVDSILIDEARTPLIISGPAEQSAHQYMEVDRIVPRLKKDLDYTVDEKAHSTMLTDAGVERVETLLSVENLYDPSNLKIIHHVNNALRAHTLYKRDVNYLVDAGKVVIIDEFTGRKMEGRRWSDGLHQAIEAKENVSIEEENQTLATITYQNFFRMYKKLSGMTGTADTEAAEFHHIYKLQVNVIPTNKPILRKDHADLVYKNEGGKFIAVFEDILDSHDRGQPVLVGTTSVEKSELLATLLRKKKVPFNVLNAKQHEREAHVVAQAGRKGAITISTNMAGRGTDIILGGNAEALARAEFAGLDAEPDGESDGDPYRGTPGPSTKLEELMESFSRQCGQERDQVLEAGGLKIIGTERHESRRIDNQLRGRSGRQGDPGESRFYLSLEDDLMRIFGADRISNLMERMGMEEDVPIEHKWVTRAVENAQKKVEGSNFDSRKNVLEYDDVMNQQRKTIYGLRHQILGGKYYPTLSEDEEKAGQEPEPPSTSGDWTIEDLAKELRPRLTTMIEVALEAAAEEAENKDSGEKKAAPEPVLEGDDPIYADVQDLDDPDDPPMWRQLRHEIWRQFGTWTDVNEELFQGDKEALIDEVSTSVAHSIIQQRERLYDLSDTIIGQQVAVHCPVGAHEDEWDPAALNTSLRDIFGAEFELNTSGKTQGEIANEAWEVAEKRVAQRMDELDRSWLLYFIRHFYLEEIDQRWIEHLTTMDHLRQGIGLRGYGQKDPKKEYKKEGFDLFAEMMSTIEANVCTKIFHVQIQRDEAPIPELRAKDRAMQESHQDGSDANSPYGDAADGGKTAKEKQKTVRRDKPKVGRNDPCPCGSGKKYKKCHGREGQAQL